MARKSTGKDHAEINLAIWGDDDWLDLTPPAQHLYFVLWTSPQLSYCGSGEWHPGRIAAMSKTWTPESVEVAAVELSRELFLLIDTDTEEFLLRSWIKHDALWKKPNMAVSMANARAALASRKLRGVIVHEVQKIKARNLADAKASDEVTVSGGWQRDAVKDLLAQKAVDPATLDPFTPTLTPSPTPTPTPTPTPGLTPGLTVSPGVGVNPPPNPGPTPTPAPLTPTTKGGYVSTEGHLGADGLPSPHCQSHPNGTERPCRPCGDAKARHFAAVKQRDDDELQRRWALRDNCPLCDSDGWARDDEGAPTIRCTHPDSPEVRHA